MKRGKPELDDWITFLSCNVNTNVSLTIVLFSSIILISVVILQLSNNDDLNIFTLVPLLILEAAVFIKFYQGANASRKYQKLLHKIMTGELTTNEEILKEYNDFALFSKKSKL